MFGFGKAPPSIHADVAQLLRSDGFAVLDSRNGSLPDEIRKTAPSARILISTVWKRLREVFAYRGMSRAWRPARIVAKTLSSVEINACAGQVTDPHSPYYFISLNAGLIIHVADRILRILSDPRAFPALGTSTREDSGRDGKLLEVVPRDKVREELAIATATMAVATVVAHEIGHVVRGHVWMARTHFESARLYEVSPEQSSGFPDSEFVELRRAMELDADLYAGGVLGTLLFQGRPTGWRAAGGNERIRLALLSLAITCAFRSFSSQSPDEIYHTPFLRAQLILSRIRDIAPDIQFDFEDFRSSSWLPEALNILAPDAGTLSTVKLRRDHATMRETMSYTARAQRMFQEAREAMKAGFGKPRRGMP